MYHGFDHIEFYVGNAYTTAYFFARALGFRPLAQAGLETGMRDRQSYVVGQGDIRLVFTNALEPHGAIAEHVRRHGDSMRDLALRVDDTDSAFERCLSRGARAVAPPRTFEDEHGTVRHAAIQTFGDTVHSLVDRKNYHGAFLPEYRAWPSRRPDAAPRLRAVDHVACCVDPGTLGQWMDFYEGAFGFQEVHHEDIVTEHSAMNSKVIGSEGGGVKLPLMEPARGRSKSQIEEFLEYHHGSGGQHLAFLSDDLLGAVGQIRADGWIDFLETPDTYYDVLPDRIGTIDEPLDQIRSMNVLVDRDRWGYLLQVFTRPVTGRPTSFLEVVQRKGARGFGAGNVRALFEAVERAQAARGNL